MTNKKHLIIYLIISFILISLISIFSLNIYSKKALDKEVKNILKKDVSKDDFTVKTKSLFKYEKVEKAIKEYMKDYSQNIKKANNIINDETIKAVLSSSNYESDGPKFEKSLKLLENKTKEFKDTINKLLKMTDEKEVLKYIEKYKLSDKYVKLYKEYMLGKEFKKDIEQNKSIINNINDTGLKILNTDSTALKMLKDNPEGWVMQEGTISFYSKDLMDQYNSLIQQIKK